MLTIRRRGRIWHCRGSVRVGQSIRRIAEHSSGLRDRQAAKAYAANLETKIREELLYGRAVRSGQVNFAQIGQLYIERPEGLHPNDVWRIGQLNEVLGDYSLADMLNGWAGFKRARCGGLAPATVARFRDTLQAAINYSATELGYDAPRIPTVKFRNERVRWLTLNQAERLTGSYAPHVRPIILVFRFQGARTQEALQLQWQNVDLERETMFFDRTKNGDPRTIRMAPRVATAVRQLWADQDQPDTGHVFLNRFGKPYADTRDYKYPGGNPLRQQHQTALKRAKVAANGGDNFTIHDWRHHWASWCVMEGIDLETIKRMGGWKSLRMVERYAAVSDEHMEAAVARLRA